MEYGQIIKRAWKITWRYKALWVLGLFAGLSGCNGSGGGSGGGGSSDGGTAADFGNFSRDGFRFGPVREAFDSYLPMIVAAVLLLIGLALVWSVLSVAARGALVIGVDEAERGGPRRLGALWASGFHRFWSLVGLGIVLKLPVVIATLLILGAIFVPIFGSLAGGGEPGVELLLPICGVLAIGLPVVVIGAIVLDALYLLALRYLMLGGHGVFESAGNAWKFFRARFKDTALMYVINGALNIAGSLVLAIPAIALGFAVAVPLVAGFATDRWDVVVGPILLFVVLVMAMAYAYTAVWGTFTSALWTLFFRDAMRPAATDQPAPYVTPEPQFSGPAPEAPPTPPAPAAPEAPPAPPAPPEQLQPPQEPYA